MPRSKGGVYVRPEIEVRKNKNGTLDEVVVRVGKRVVLHLEQMADNHWWMNIGSDRQVDINFTSRDPIIAVAQESGGANAKE